MQRLNHRVAALGYLQSRVRGDLRTDVVMAHRSFGKALQHIEEREGPGIGLDFLHVSFSFVPDGTKQLIFHVHDALIGPKNQGFLFL